MAGFGIGQLVQVNNPRNLAYGRIAMVLCGKKGGRSQVRFADLPKGVAASPDPTGFVNVFDDDELAAIKGIPIAAFYGLVTIEEQNGGQEYSQQVLVHGQIGQSLEVTAQAIAQNWYEEAGEVGKWDDRLEAYVLFEDCSHTVAAEGCDEISLVDYIHLKRVLSDQTPGYASTPATTL